jgi:phytoene dehydrogenase-like protein
MPSMPKHPGLMARFGMSALHSAKAIAHRCRSERTRALLAGLTAHSVLRLDQTLSCAFGLLMGAPAHAVGWPIPRGRSQSLTNALCGYLAALGGSIKTGCRVDSLAALSEYDLILCDVTPRQLLNLGTEQLSKSYKRDLRHFRYGPGVFKADYTLSQPVPWKAADCLRAATVHLVGTFDEIALSEEIVQNGQHAARPFVLLVQPPFSMRHELPRTSTLRGLTVMFPMARKLTCCRGWKTKSSAPLQVSGRLSSFAAPFSPEDLERMDANLVGGDTGGGAVNLLQFLFRPTWKHYSTSAKNIYIGSASTPPGGGVHGMCGYHAAKIALRAMR